MSSTEVIIKPKQKWQLVDIPELIRYNNLFYIFIWRDIKVRYKQTVLGVLWVILQPIITAVIFTIFFGRLAKIPSGELPYHLFVYIGLVFWTFFSGAVTQAANSLIDSVEIIKKVYFPREILPISAVLTSMVDFSINFIIMVCFAIYLGFVPNLLAIPFLFIAIIITLLTSSGLGLFLAAFNVKYRDVRYILPFFIQILLFLSPIIYPASAIRDSWRLLFAINPMTGVIETMRVIFAGSLNIDINVLIISSLSSLIIFFFGMFYFRQTERYFADLV